MMSEKKALKAIPQRILATVLTLALLILTFPTALMASAEESPQGYIVLSVEKFTLGLGYIREPELVPFYEDETAGIVLSRVLGTGNFKDNRVVGTAGQNISYLSHIKDPDPRSIDPPQYVKDHLGDSIGGRRDADWLGEFDYTTGSGWTYTRNNWFANYGLSACKLEEGMVIRVQYTVYMGDINGPGSSDVDNTTAVDRGPLMTKVAVVNSAENKEELLADAAIKAAYDHAYEVLTDLTRSESEINQACEVLTAALPQSEEHTLTYDSNGAQGKITDDTLYRSGDVAVLQSSRPLNCPEDKFFSNWNTKADGTGRAYLEGASLRFQDEDVTLYAIWDNQYAVTYDVNAENGGGASTPPVDKNRYFPGRKVTLSRISSSKPDTGKVFLEWNTKADGTGESYAVGDKMTMGGSDITLYAIWADGCRITYDANGATKGTAPNDASWYLPGALVSARSASALYKDTQKFKEWNTKADGTGDACKAYDKLAMPEGGVTLYAVYGDTYTVSYDANGGTGSAPADTKTYLEGEKASAKNGGSLTKGENQVFKEWNTKADGTGDAYPSGGSIVIGTENVTLYAIYTTGYRVLYDLNGGAGSVTDANRYYDGKNVSLKSSSSVTPPEGLLFKEWNSNRYGTGTSYKSSFTFGGEEDITLYAIYTPGHTLTYDLNGGTGYQPVNTKLYKAGEYVYLEFSSSKLPTPPAGQVWVGWTTDPAKPELADIKITSFPNEDVTVYAVYRDGMALKYDLNGGSGTAPTVGTLYGGYKASYHYTDKGTGVTAPEGTGLKEWNTKADGSGVGVVPGKGLDLSAFLEDGLKELTLYAVYAPQYTVTYDTNGGSDVVNSTKYFEGDTLTLPAAAPTKAGVEFRRWNTRKDGSGIDYDLSEKIVVGSENITLYARWSANSVLYDANGGENAPADGGLYAINAEVAAASAAGMTAPEGKRFIAWNTSKDGSGTNILPGETFRIAKGDRMLYAVWGPEGVEQTLNGHLAALLKNVPSPGLGTTGGEWSVMALARAGYPVPSDYFAGYYGRVAQELKDNEGVLSTVKYTEYSRVIMAFTAIGYDPADIAGYDMPAMLTDMKKISAQGINGPIFALLALDSGAYAVAENADAQEPVTRDALIRTILEKEIEGGGWALFGSSPDADITAMALQALAPYQDRADVKPFIDRALTVLSNSQDAYGRFGSVDGVCAESTAQVIIALTALSVDPMTDSRFVKENGNTVSALLLYALEDGGFKHLLNGAYNDMATDQGVLALVAYDRFVRKENALYDMTDAARILNPDQEAAAAALAKAKADAKAELESYKNADDYREAQQAELAQVIAGGKAAIDAAAEMAGVNEALAVAKAAADAVRTDAQLTAEEEAQKPTNPTEKENPATGPAHPCAALLVCGAAAVLAAVSRKKKNV